MNNILIILAIGLLIAIYVNIKINREKKDIDIPLVVPERPLLYGYYGTMDTQAKDTKAYTTLLWEAQFQGIEKATQNILEGQKHTVLDVSPQVFVKYADKGKNYKLNTNAEAHLVELFSYLENKGALQFIKHIVPMDEPNTNVRSLEDFQTAINIIRKVASRYADLSDVKLACIYAAKPDDYYCIEQMDLVGVDDYDAKSQIFSNGTYANLKSKLRPDQRTMVIPGGAFGQDITPFYNFAHNNQEVAAIVPFTWLGPMVPADRWIGLGNDDNHRKQSYIDVGYKLISL